MAGRTRKAVPEGEAAALGTLAEVLGRVPDPRQPYGWRPEYPPISLGALLQLTVVAILCGARSLYAIAQWGRERAADDPELLEKLGLPAGRSPCVATLHRLFKALDVVVFERELTAWLAATGVTANDTLALDGKTLRGIHGKDVPGVHLVAAYAHESATVLAQIRTEGKGQELAAAARLLDQLPLAGRLITGDALFTQRSICTQILDGGGDYLFPVKDNQPTLRAELEGAFSPVGGERSRGDRATGGADLAATAAGAGPSAAELGDAGIAESAAWTEGGAHALGLGGSDDHADAGELRGGGEALARGPADLSGRAAPLIPAEGTGG